MAYAFIKLQNEWTPATCKTEHCPVPSSLGISRYKKRRKRRKRREKYKNAMIITSAPPDLPGSPTNQPIQISAQLTPNIDLNTCLHRCPPQVFFLKKRYLLALLEDLLNLGRVEPRQVRRAPPEVPDGDLGEPDAAGEGATRRGGRGGVAGHLDGHDAAEGARARRVLAPHQAHVVLPRHGARAALAGRDGGCQGEVGGGAGLEGMSV